MSTPSSQDAATLRVCRTDCRGVAAAPVHVLHGHGADVLDADQQTVAFS